MQTINIKKAKADLRTRKIFSASGWGVSDFKLISAPDHNGPTVYLCDIEHQQLYVVASATNAVALIRKVQKKHRISFQRCHETLSTLLLQRVTKKYENDAAFLNHFVVFTLMYAFQTQSFEHVQNNTNPAMIVLNYIDHSDGTPLIRPNPLPDTTGLFAPEDIQRIANIILGQDKKSHPTRFPRAKLIQFTARHARALKLDKD